MSHEHHSGPPPGEAPRWLDSAANVKKLTRLFFGFVALVFLSDIVFLYVHQHASFGHGGDGEQERTALQAAETWFGFYPVYSFVGIILLVVISVGLRKLVMRDEDYYSKDYPESTEQVVEDEHHA